MNLSLFSRAFPPHLRLRVLSSSSLQYIITLFTLFLLIFLLIILRHHLLLQPDRPPPGQPLIAGHQRLQAADPLGGDALRPAQPTSVRPPAPQQAEGDRVVEVAEEETGKKVDAGGDGPAQAVAVHRPEMGGVEATGAARQVVVVQEEGHVGVAHHIRRGEVEARDGGGVVAAAEGNVRPGVVGEVELLNSIFTLGFLLIVIISIITTTTTIIIIIIVLVDHHHLSPPLRGLFLLRRPLLCLQKGLTLLPGRTSAIGA